MRIEAYTQIQQLYQSKVAGRSHNSGSTAQAETDKLQISSVGKDIHVVKAVVANCPDVREELTAPIKAQVQAGTYEVSNEKFAEKLLNKYAELR